MTLLMSDAQSHLSAKSKDAMSKNALFDILYADDTLLLGREASCVEEFAAAVESAGAAYGMTLHWGKTQTLSVGEAGPLTKPDGNLYADSESLLYLGALLYGHGRSDSEISRKLGAARADFNQLQRLWGHSSVTTQDKIKYLNAFIMSKLRYGLATIWLVTAQCRRLNAFFARCLRKILRISSAYISRISNAVVFARAGAKPFTDQLLKHQLTLLHKVAATDATNPMRRDTFVGATLNPQIGQFVRRVGRPRQDWATQLLREASERVGEHNFQPLLASGKLQWKAAIERSFAMT